MSSSNHLCLLFLPPHTSKLKFSDRSFSNSSTRLWNSLPISNLSQNSHLHLSHPSPLKLVFHSLCSLYLAINSSLTLKLTSSLLPSSFFFYPHQTFHFQLVRRRHMSEHPRIHQYPYGFTEVI